MFSRILCKVLVIAILIGIMPTDSIFTSHLNVEASTLNSITVRGWISYSYKAHGGIDGVDAVPVLMPHVAVLVTLYVFYQRDDGTLFFDRIGYQAGYASVHGRFDIAVPTRALTPNDGPINARVTAFARDYASFVEDNNLLTYVEAA